MRIPHKYIRPAIYIGATLTGAGVVAASAIDSSSLGETLVGARQLFGLWALGLLLAAMIIGPIVWILPWLPMKSELVYARRAVGVSAAIYALLHLVCYIVSLLLRDRREFYLPGWVWVAGLVLGLMALVGMANLALTSTDASVKKQGGKKWKQLHRSVYPILGEVLIHALFNGADFGWHRAPDVTQEPDAGAGVGFACVSAVWLALFIIRRKGWRWKLRAEAKR